MSKIENAKRALPEKPNLENLKKQARSLLKAVHVGSPGAKARVEAVHPRPRVAAGQERFALTDAQLVLAREYGFESWPKLKAHVARRSASADPVAVAIAELSRREALAAIERLYERLQLVARRVEWVSKVELFRAKQQADLAGLIRAALAHCDAPTKQAVLASSDAQGLVNAACAALEPILSAGGPRPQGVPHGAAEEAEAWLVVLHAARHPHLLGRRFALGAGSTSIGRSTANRILLHSDSVSREHARIERRDSGFVLVDQNSTNGCFVNEGYESVTERALEDGDRLAIGDAVLLFLSGSGLEQKYEAAIEYLAQHDALTRTHNQKAWFAETERHVLYARGRDESLSALLIDIDQLGELSTRIGQLGGNALLLRVAQVLREELGQGGLIGRHSETQFAVAMPGVDAAAATALANRLRQAVGARSLLLFGETVTVTASVGVATLYDTTGTDELLEDARAALGRAQRAGRNAVSGPREAAA